MSSSQCDVPPLLLDLIEGMLPLQIARIDALSGADRAALAQQAADSLATGADRLTAPGNFTDRRERAEALTALTAAIALGRRQPGGITWAGHHWCTTPHPHCPDTMKTTTEMTDGRTP